MSKLFVLSKAVKSRLETIRGHEMKCELCGKAFHEGEKVVSKMSGGRSNHRRKYYHPNCFESLWL